MFTISPQQQCQNPPDSYRGSVNRYWVIFLLISSFFTVGFAQQSLVPEYESGQLFVRLTPDHPFGCKRPLLSSNYYPAFNRPNLELVTDAYTQGVATVTDLIDAQNARKRSRSAATRSAAPIIFTATTQPGTSA